MRRVVHSNPMRSIGPAHPFFEACPEAVEQAAEEPYPLRGDLRQVDGTNPRVQGLLIWLGVARKPCCPRKK